MRGICRQLSAAFCLLLIARVLPAQAEGDYARAVRALRPDHYYRMDETEIGPPLQDDNGDPVPVVDAGGIQYDSEVVDTGFAAELIHGHHEGKFAPIDVTDPLALVGVAGPLGFCGLEEENLAFFANNAGSVDLGPSEGFSDDVMTVAMWFQAFGSEGGDRIFTNNWPDRSAHFQITHGGSANLVIGIDPTSETVADALQVPDSAKPTKDGQWHHIVASRNGPTMQNVLVVIDGVDYTSALVDSTTGWGATGTKAHIASRPGGDGGPNQQTLNGAVDEVAVWIGRQLTVEESKDLYNIAVGCIPPATVTRKLSRTEYAAGESTDVTLTIDSSAPGIAITIDEVVPGNVLVSQISDGGTESDTGSIQWNLAGVTQKSVTYKLTPAACTGDLSFPGSSFAVDISVGRVLGDNTVQRSLTKHDLSPWSSVDIGDVLGPGGVARLGPREAFVSGNGTGVRLVKDSFHFLSVPGAGDFEFSARIDCFDTNGKGGNAGLMVRDTLDPHSANLFLFLTPSSDPGLAGTLRASLRRETNPSRSTSPLPLTGGDVAALPVHLKIKRVGTQITLERSADGVAFTELGSKEVGPGSTQVNLRDAVLLGMGVSGTGGPARMVFSDVKGVPELPSDAPPAATFRRGDSDMNGEIQLTDAVAVLGYLFLGQQSVKCHDAGDADDNGKEEISDAIRILGYLFLGTAPPPAPGPSTCGPDEAKEDPDLGCETSC